MVEAVWGWAGHGRKGSIANVGFSEIFNFFWVSFGDFGEKKRARERREARRAYFVRCWIVGRDERWKVEALHWKRNNITALATTKKVSLFEPTYPG
jgi:hypothetical protein